MAKNLIQTREFAHLHRHTAGGGLLCLSHRLSGIISYSQHQHLKETPASLMLLQALDPAQALVLKKLAERNLTDSTLLACYRALTCGYLTTCQYFAGSGLRHTIVVKPGCCILPKCIGDFNGNPLSVDVAGDRIVYNNFFNNCIQL